jgi:F-type H+-transporting ATPase subunit b
MNLLPDFTFIFQLFIFLTVLFSLNFILFHPALRVLEKRKTATEGMKEEVTKLTTLTQEKIAACEEKIFQAKLRGIALKEKIRKEGEEAAAKIVSQARATSESLVMEMEARLHREQDQAELQLKKDLAMLARLMAERVLERPIS